MEPTTDSVMAFENTIQVVEKIMQGVFPIIVGLGIILMFVYNLFLEYYFNSRDNIRVPVLVYNKSCTRLKKKYLRLIYECKVIQTTDEKLCVEISNRTNEFLTYKLFSNFELRINRIYNTLQTDKEKEIYQNYCQILSSLMDETQNELKVLQKDEDNNEAWVKFCRDFKALSDNICNKLETELEEHRNLMKQLDAETRMVENAHSPLEKTQMLLKLNKECIRR